MNSSRRLLNLARWMLAGSGAFLAVSQLPITRAIAQPNQEVPVVREPYFLDCEKALARPDFKPLKTYYAKRPDEPQPNSCFRLSDREFLVIITDTAPIAQGLSYCDLRRKDGECLEGDSMPGLQVEREFIARRKRYVLFSTSMLSHGVMSGGWAVLRLAPKSIHPRGYVVESLPNIGDSGEDAAGFCGDTIPKNEKATKVEGVEVRNEGSDQVALVFTTTAQDCSNMKTTTETRTFTLRDGRFLETK